MTDNEIKKILAFLKNKSDNPFAQDLFKKLSQKVPQGHREALILKFINPLILNKILYGEKK